MRKILKPIVHEALGEAGSIFIGKDLDKQNLKAFRRYKEGAPAKAPLRYSSSKDKLGLEKFRLRRNTHGCTNCTKGE